MIFLFFLRENENKGKRGEGLTFVQRGRLLLSLWWWWSLERCLSLWMHSWIQFDNVVGAGTWISKTLLICEVFEDDHHNKDSRQSLRKKSKFYETRYSVICKLQGFLRLMMMRIVIDHSKRNRVDLYGSSLRISNPKTFIQSWKVFLWSRSSRDGCQKGCHKSWSTFKGRWDEETIKFEIQSKSWSGWVGVLEWIQDQRRLLLKVDVDMYEHLL